MLRAAGVALALPVLESFQPRAFGSAPPPIRRMVCICTPLGLHAQAFFPAESGKGYALSPYLEPLQELRGRFSR
jgi:Protein of unknown function (DUF1552).